MSTSLIKFIQKWWWGIVAVLLGLIYIYGIREMYFHQDDLDWFILVNRPFWEVISYPIGDHVNYLFRVLFKAEWDIFGLYFPGYYAVSLLMHASVIYLIYLLSYVSSLRRDLAICAALLFTINTNWTEIILWISGQTISITAIFVLLAMYAIWKKKFEIPTLFLVGWTSALGIGMLGATLLVYGFKKSTKILDKFNTKTGWGTLLIIGGVAAAYFYLGSDGTKIEFSWKWVMQVAMVWVLAMINTVMGRLILPIDRFEIVRIVIVLVSMSLLAWKYKAKLLPIWNDAWSRFLILQIWIYYAIVAAGRAQYGIGIMRAERYGYLGLALFLLLAARIIRNTKLGKYVWIVPLLIVIQSYGLYARARVYVERPQQLKALVQEVRLANPQGLNPDSYLPRFVLNDERLKYGDLLQLIID